MRILTNPDLRIASGFVLRSDAPLRRMVNAISPAFSIKKNTAAVFFAAAANTKEETMQKKQHVSIIQRHGPHFKKKILLVECIYQDCKAILIEKK